MGDEEIGYEDDVRVIKKDPNRRLYDTQTSQYIKLEDIRDMVVAEEAFIVIDSKSGEDLTRSVLLQLIIEQESTQSALFSTDNLKSFIRFHSQDTQRHFVDFFDKSLNFFQQQQQEFRDDFPELLSEEQSEKIAQFHRDNMDALKKIQDVVFKKKA